MEVTGTSGGVIVSCRHAASALHIAMRRRRAWNRAAAPGRSMTALVSEASGESAAGTYIDDHAQQSAASRQKSAPPAVRQGFFF